MVVYWCFVFFIFGVTFGSFYNVVGLRVPMKITFTDDHSRCPHCLKSLRWYELIPIISYISQQGLCRHCQTPISRLYPVMEFLTGILFTYSIITVGFQLELVTALLFISILIIISVSDLVYMVIPNSILLFFFPLFIFCRVISPLNPWYDAGIGAIVGFLIIALIIFLSNGGMGAGDMKLFFILGIVLGWKKVLITLFLASCIGAIIGICLRLLNKVNPKQAIPFGPYIAIAAIITYFFGENLLAFYLSFF